MLRLEQRILPEFLRIKKSLIYSMIGSERNSIFRACVVALLLVLSVSSIIAYASSPPSSTSPSPSPPPTSSKGCAEGWGYDVDDPDPICEPLDKIGEAPPKDVGFCATLGCPYNPPNLPVDGGL
jgi:hypothetical protein